MRCDGVPARIARDGRRARPSIVAELDGFATHGTRDAFERDRDRDRALLIAGYPVIPITWRQLTQDAPALATQIRALL